MRALTARGWGTIAASLLLIAVVIAAFASSSGVRGPTPPAPVEIGLSASLSRCRDLGAAGKNDPACQAIWRPISQRLLGEDRKAAGDE
jgi:conjugative transfer region protein TrbK